MASLCHDKENKSADSCLPASFIRFPSDRRNGRRPTKRVRSWNWQNLKGLARYSERLQTNEKRFAGIPASQPSSIPGSEHASDDARGGPQRITGDVRAPQDVRIGAASSTEPVALREPGCTCQQRVIKSGIQLSAFGAPVAMTRSKPPPARQRTRLLISEIRQPSPVRTS
jgi:hypothetical protein